MFGAPSAALRFPRHIPVTNAPLPWVCIIVTRFCRVSNYMSHMTHVLNDNYNNLQEAFYALDEDGDGHLTPAELTHALRSTDALAKSGFAAEIPPEALEQLIAASDLYGEGYVDVDEFLAAMLANSNYTKTKDAVSRPVPCRGLGRLVGSCFC
eukprot:GHRQ01027024.1.p1 GENE.GHRQ01027024.1~~GHRQ01027024.1.p1  ORF type:complete len:153 (-),score=31.48 GHRQ01027024.1:654-1112(-)